MTDYSKPTKFLTRLVDPNNLTGKPKIVRSIPVPGDLVSYSYFDKNGENRTMVPPLSLLLRAYPQSNDVPGSLLFIAMVRIFAYLDKALILRVVETQYTYIHWVQVLYNNRPWWFSTNTELAERTLFDKSVKDMYTQMHLTRYFGVTVPPVPAEEKKAL